MENINLKPLIKRIGAYMLDILIVLILSSVISYIKIFDKQNEKYQELLDEYEIIYNEYTELTVSLNNSYKDEVISEEEYQKLISVDTYKNIFEEKYDDKIIDEKEYQKINTELNEKYTKTAKEYQYKMQKSGIYSSIITLVCTFLYFGILQYFLKGQTLGKKLFKLQIVSSNDKKINIITFILRTLIINNVFLNGIDLIFLSSSPEIIYLKASKVISLLISIVEALTIFFIITREDQKGLHDILLNTKVIERENIKNQTKSSKKIIEAKYKEKKAS